MKVIVWVLRATVTVVAVVLATVGVLAQPLAVPAWIMLGSMVGGGVALYKDQRDGHAAFSKRGSLLVAAVIAWVTVIVCLALTGISVLMGPAGWPVIVAALLSTATVWLWRRVHHRMTQEPPSTGDSASAEEVPSYPRAVSEAMSTPELCLAWRRSYRALTDAPGGQTHADIVIMRRAMLDELERRDPTGFRRWLEDGARASSDPGRYMSPHVGDV